MGRLKEYYQEFLENLKYSSDEEHSDSLPKELLKYECNTIKDSLVYSKNELSDLENEFYDDIFNNLLQNKDDKIYAYIEKSKRIYANPSFSNLDDFKKFISKIKHYKYNVYYSPAVYSGWRLAENVNAYNCLFVDVDDIQGYENIDFTQFSKVEIIDFLKSQYNLINEQLPHYVVLTGHGLHFYYLTEKLDLCNDDNISLLRDKYINSMIYYFSADSSCSDKPRVLRCPDTFNVKNVEDIRITKIYKLYDTSIKDIHRLDFALSDEQKVDEYIEQNKQEKSQKREETRERNKANATKPQHKKKKQEAKPQKIKQIKQKPIKESKQKINNVDFESKNLKLITEAKDPAWRYKNIIYDLHNYYVHRKGQIQGYRHKFFYIFTIYLKYMGKSKENAIKDMQIYVDDDFKDEFLELVDNIYNKHYNILRNQLLQNGLILLM